VTGFAQQVGFGLIFLIVSDLQLSIERSILSFCAKPAARHDAKLATLTARWDARREAVHPLHADAAVDMVAATHVFSTTTTLCDLGV